MSDTTIVVQGRLNNHSLTHLKDYRKIGPVIVVGWEYETPETLELARANCKQAGAELVILTTPPVGAIFNSQNTYAHAMSTSTGMSLVRTEYAIKVRGDEFYENLQPFVERLKSEPYRTWCSSVYFRRDVQHKFHLGDHIIAGRVSTLSPAFRWVMEACRIFPPLVEPPLPEQLIARAIMLAQGELPDNDRSREQMLKHFGVVSLKHLGKLACKIHMPHRRGVHRGYIYADDRGAINGTGVCAHDSIEEI